MWSRTETEIMKCFNIDFSLLRNYISTNKKANNETRNVSVLIFYFLKNYTYLCEQELKVKLGKEFLVPGKLHIFMQVGTNKNETRNVSVKRYYYFLNKITLYLPKIY